MFETKETFGLGFRPQHYGWVTTHNPPEVDVFEIVSENFMGVGGRPKFFLEKLRANYSVIMHGVGLSIGSKGPFDPLYLKRLKELTLRVEPQIVSDHLSWGQLGGRNSHDLLPISYTHESMNDLVGKLGYLQEFLGRRFFLENASAYVAFQDGDYDEAGFFAELLKRTGAGILLDVNNLFVNQKNLGHDPEDFFRALRPCDVGYFHLAGHSDQGDVLVDTHDQPVPDSVWALYAKAKEFFPGIPSIVEWDGNIPDFPILLEECEKARRFVKNKASESLKPQPREVLNLSAPQRSNSENYSQFFGQIVRPFGIEEEGTANLINHGPVPAMVGLKVYNHAYFLRLEEVLQDTYPALSFITEEEGFRYLVAAYLEACPPIGSSLKSVGQGLPGFLKDPDAEVDFDFGVPLAVLGDLAALECARADAFTAHETQDVLTPDQLRSFTPRQWETVRFTPSEAMQLVRCSFAVLPVLHAIDKEELPDPPEEEDVVYCVTRRRDFGLSERKLEHEEACLSICLQRGATLKEACDAIGQDRPGFYGTEGINFVATKLLEWSEEGWLVMGDKTNQAVATVDAEADSLFQV